MLLVALPEDMLRLVALLTSAAWLCQRVRFREDVDVSLFLHIHVVRTRVLAETGKYSDLQVASGLGLWFVPRVREGQALRF